MGNFIEYFNGKLRSNTPNFVISLSEFHVSAMRFEFEFTFTFPASACCPIFDPVGGIPVDFSCFHTSNDLAEVLFTLSNILLKLSPEESDGSSLTCEYSEDKLRITCNGKTKQLYPGTRDRSILRLGYECGKEKNLEGFSYHIKGTFTNSTLCEPMSEPVSYCPDLQYTSYPNPFGNRNINEAKTYLGVLKMMNNRGKEPCLEDKIFQKLICRAAFYKCPQEGRQTELIMPCRESCEQIVKACGDGSDILKHFDCSSGSMPSFLPLASESKCQLFHVVCPPPPTIHNGFIWMYKNYTEYPALTEITIGCNDGFTLEGSNKSVCQYGGYWKPIPECKQDSHVQNNSKTIVIVLGIVTCVIIAFVFIAIVLWHHIKKNRKQETNSLIMEYQGTRNKSYDVFVSYFDDSRFEDHPQRDEVWNHVLPFLEQTCDPPFKVKVHPRDFLAGILIQENIVDAISNSNAILVMMSKEYAASTWCRAEFEEAIHEHREDNAFRILVIMLEPVEELGQLNAYMSSFIKNRTYLDINDHEIWHKIQNILQDIKEPLHGVLERQENEGEITREQNEVV